MFLGRWEIDDLVTFAVNTHTPSTGAAVDADSAPTYRVYEDETGTAILTGTMALLDDANTVGQYSEQITLSAANGFEVGKSYTIRIAAIVATVTGASFRTFQVEAAPALSSQVDSIEGTLGAAGAGLTAVPAAVWSTTLASIQALATTTVGRWLYDKLASIGAGFLFGAVSPVSSKGLVETVQGIDYSITHGELRVRWVKPAAASWPTDLTGFTITAKITIPGATALTFAGAVVTATGDSREVAVALSAANSTSIPVNEGPGWEYVVYAVKDAETHLLAQHRWVSRQLP